MTSDKYVAGQATVPSDGKEGGGLQRLWERVVHAVRMDEPVDDDGATTAMCMLPVYRSEPSAWPPDDTSSAEVCPECREKAT